MLSCPIVKHDQDSPEEQAIVEPEDQFAHPQLVANQMVAPVEDPDLGSTTQIGVPIHLLGTPGAIQGAQPRLGAHDAEIWAEVGVTGDALAAWAEKAEPLFARFTPADADVDAVVIAGTSHGVTGAVTRETTAPLYLDLHLPAGASFSQPLPAGHNAFVYVYRGALTLGAETVPVRTMAILANDADSDGVRIEATTDTRALLIAGRPLGEPIAQYGPFVMNTEQEIYQAVADYRAGRLAA